MFFSHRFKQDATLYSATISALRRNPLVGITQDVSVPEGRMITGPRGGWVSEQVAKREIAARIYSSDVVVASSRVGVGSSEWLRWEIETAALCYSVPVVMVKGDDQVYMTKIARGLREAGCLFRISRATPEAIAYAIAHLVRTPVQTGVLLRAPDASLAYRGPTWNALEHALTEKPFEPTL